MNRRYSGPREIADSLQHRQAHQRLRTGHEGAPGLQRVFIVEGDFVMGAGRSCVPVSGRSGVWRSMPLILRALI